MSIRFIPPILPNEPGRIDYRVRAGQRIVIAIIAINLAMSFGTLLFYLIRLGPISLEWQPISRGLTILLYVCLYRGLRWAHWLSAFLLIISAVLGIVSGGGLLGAGATGLPLIGLALVQGGSGAVLLFSKRAEAFLQHQRDRSVAGQAGS